MKLVGGGRGGSPAVFDLSGRAEAGKGFEGVAVQAAVLDGEAEGIAQGVKVQIGGARRVELGAESLRPFKGEVGDVERSEVLAEGVESSGLIEGGSWGAGQSSWGGAAGAEVGI